MGANGMPDPNTHINKNLLIMFRASPVASMSLEIWDIDTSTRIFNGFHNGDGPASQSFTDATHAPLFIGCNNHLITNGVESLTNHYHGETILYNFNFTTAQMVTTKDYLINKWKAVV